MTRMAKAPSSDVVPPDEQELGKIGYELYSKAFNQTEFKFLARVAKTVFREIWDRSERGAVIELIGTAIKELPEDEFPDKCDKSWRWIGQVLYGYASQDQLDYLAGLPYSYDARYKLVKETCEKQGYKRSGSTFKRHIIRVVRITLVEILKELKREGPILSPALPAGAPIHANMLASSHLTQDADIAGQVLASGRNVVITCSPHVRYGDVLECIAHRAIRSDVQRLAADHQLTEFMRYFEGEEQGLSTLHISTLMAAGLFDEKSAIRSRLGFAVLQPNELIFPIDAGRPDRFVLDVAYHVWHAWHDFDYDEDDDDVIEVWQLNIDQLLREFHALLANCDLAPILLIENLGGNTQIRKFIDTLQPSRLLATATQAPEDWPAFPINIPAPTRDELHELLTYDLRDPQLIEAARSAVDWLYGNEVAAKWVNRYMCSDYELFVDEKANLLRRCAARIDDLAYGARLPTSASLDSFAREIVDEIDEQLWSHDNPNYAQAALATVACLAPYEFDEQLLDQLLGLHLPRESYVVRNRDLLNNRVADVLVHFGVLNAGSRRPCTWWGAEGITCALRKVLRPRVLHDVAQAIVTHMKIDARERQKATLDNESWIDHSIWLRHCFEANEVLGSFRQSWPEMTLDRTTKLANLLPQWAS